MRKSESTWRVKGGSDLVVGGDWAEVPCVEVVDLPNEMIDVVRRKRVVLLQIVRPTQPSQVTIFSHRGRQSLCRSSTLILESR